MGDSYSSSTVSLVIVVDRVLRIVTQARGMVSTNRLGYLERCQWEVESMKMLFYKIITVLSVITLLCSFASGQTSDRVWFTKAFTPTGLSNPGPAVAMAVRGNKLAIGYPMVATVVIYERNGYGEWQQISALTNPDNLSRCFFGQTLGFSGDDLIVGSYNFAVDPMFTSNQYRDPIEPSNVTTHIFRQTSTGQYVQVQKIIGSGLTVATSSLNFATTVPVVLNAVQQRVIRVYVRDGQGKWIQDVSFSWNGYGPFSSLTFIEDKLVAVQSAKLSTMTQLSSVELRFKTYSLLDRSLGLTDAVWPLNGVRGYMDGFPNGSGNLNEPSILTFAKLPFSGWNLVRHDSIFNNSVSGIFEGSGVNWGFASVVRTVQDEVYANDPLGGGLSSGAGSGTIHSAILSSFTNGLPFKEAFSPVDKLSFYQPFDETMWSGNRDIPYAAEAHPETNPAMMFGYSFDVNERFLASGTPRRRSLFQLSNTLYGGLYVFDRLTREFLFWIDGKNVETQLFGSAISILGDSIIVGSQSSNGKFHTVSLVNPLSISTSNSSLATGQSVTVTLDSTVNAPKGGTACLLKASTTLKGVPATIVIPEGKRTVSFSVTTDQTTDSTGTITAVANGFADATLSLKLVAPRNINSLTATKTTLEAGESTTLTAVVDKAAPAGGLMLPLAESVDIVDGPTSIVIPGGSVTGTVTLTAKSIASATTASVSVSTGLDTKALGITVNPPAITGIALTPTSVFGGASATATVTLSSAAPTGGLTVTLASNNAAAIVPASLVVPAGSTSTAITVQTKAVTAVVGATITATANGLSKSDVLNVRPPAALSTLTISPATVIGGSANAIVTVNLSDLAPSGGATVTLTSSKTTAATIPVSVVIPAGSTSANVTVTSKAVTATTAVTITAKYLTVTKTVGLTVDPPGRLVPLGSLVATPSTVYGGETPNVMLTLRSVAPSGGAFVAIQLSDTKLASAPRTVQIAEGQISVEFAVSTVEVTKSQGLRVSAQSGTSSLSADITLKPQPGVAKLSASATELRSNASTTAKIELTQAAPSSGTWVTIAISNAGIEPVQRLLVPAGLKSVSFTLRASKVTRKTSVKVSAATTGGSKETKLVIIP